MSSEESYINERLDHLGIVAGVCQEMGLAAWLDAQDPTHRKPGKRWNGHSSHDPQWLRVEPPAIVFGTAVLCQQTGRALGFVRGSRPRCESVDCLGRTLDWLYAHDPTKLFAGIARQARQIFGVKVKPGACGHHVVFRERGVRANDCAGRANRGGAGDHCHHVWLFARPS